MLTVVYVPPVMIDTFFHGVRAGDELMIGLADPEMKISAPVVGDVQSERSEELSDRARRCLEYCREERPNKYKELMNTIGDLKETYNF